MIYDDSILRGELEFYAQDQIEDMELIDPEIHLLTDEELRDQIIYFSETDETSPLGAYRPYWLADLKEEVERRGLIFGKPWTCCYCSQVNEGEESHCQQCGAPYGEAVYAEKEYENQWELDYWHGRFDEDRWIKHDC